MKKIIALVLLGLMIASLIPSYSLADASDLQWGMSKEEVIKAMGKEGIIGKGSNPGDELITYEKVPISEFELKLELSFRDDKLISKTYGIFEKAGTAYEYLKKALREKYGESDWNQKIIIYSFELLGTEISEVTLSMLHLTGGIKYETWDSIDDTGTTICLAHLTSNGLTALIYAPPKNMVPEKKLNTDGI